MSAYALLKPTVFGLEGFSYGVVSVPLAGDVVVDLVPTGRWDAESPRTVTRPAAEMLARQVKAEEALSGIGTFVGAYVCLARNMDAGSAEWDYGVITGYRWDQGNLRGTVTVVFAEGHADFAYDQSAWQELNVATYAFQPCAGRSVLDLMHGEMRAANLAVFNHFHGQDRAAARSVKATTAKLGLSLADEDHAAWFYDYSNLRVRKANVKNALDYVFYVEGARRAPKHVRPGATLFEVPAAAAPQFADAAAPTSTHAQAGATLSSDSDASSDDGVGGEPAPQAKRPRIAEPREVSRTAVAADRTATNRMRADLEELVRGGAWVQDTSGGRDPNAQFRPSGVQDRVHSALVNGKFNALEPQLLMESLQSFVDKLRFLPHPAILRGLYGLDFGLRGLAITHFMRMSTDARRGAGRTYDMTDVSRKNKIPQPTEPPWLDAVIQCADCLTGAANLLFTPVVHDLLSSLRQFLSRLQLGSAFSDASTLPDLCQWIDGRLKIFRASVAQGDMDGASCVRLHFAASHASFQETMNTITERRFLAMASKPSPPMPVATTSRSNGGSSAVPGGRQRRQDAPTPVPPQFWRRYRWKTRRLCACVICRGTRVEDATAGVPTSVSRDGIRTFLIDSEKQRAFTALLRAEGRGLAHLVRTIRHETPADPRPNKDISVPHASPRWSSFRHRRLWADIAVHGVTPIWRRELPPQRLRPANHGSASQALNTLVKSISKGQDANRYLVLDISAADEIPGLFCSPFGVVANGDADLLVASRVIHDLSWPHGDSVNDASEPVGAFPVQYDGPRALSLRILSVTAAYPDAARMLSGDVTSAFRNIPVHADQVHLFAGTVPELGILVIGLACPFGWTNSPACYWTAGAAIQHLHATTQARDDHVMAAGAFDNNAWCDDHNCVEPDVGDRLVEAELALRGAMVAVLGPAACNEEKFTGWFRVGQALGLVWDVSERTVSTPGDKIAKARQRVVAMLASPRTSRLALQKLLGSLRHVATCVPPARPFFQRVATLMRKTRRTFRTVVGTDARDDLHWFLSMLGHAPLNGVPLERLVGVQAVDFDVSMDASDEGLCVLVPARREYLQVRFTEAERQLILLGAEGDTNALTINVRELMSVVFAVLVWGPTLAQTELRRQCHVRCHIDNTAAVAWNNRRASRAPRAQMLLQLLSVLELEHNIFVTCRAYRRSRQRYDRCRQPGVELANPCHIVC